AVDHATGMGVPQSAGRLRNDGGRVLHRELAASAHQLAQVGARDILGDEEVNVAIVPGVESPHEVWMIELCLSANLACEAGHGVGGGAMSRQHFHRHDASHQPMLGLEDLAHAALTDGINDLIGSEIEFCPTDLELFGLPAIDAAELNELGG